MYKIDNKHRLTFGGRLVERIMSRYTGGKFDVPPSTTVMHFTFGASARSSANWFDNPDNSLKSSAHVVVGRDGAVIQCVDFDTRANHAGSSIWRGRSGLNTWSFGIELANWGYLTRAGATWVSWTGAAIPSPVLAVHRNGNPDGSVSEIGWEPYTQIQIETAAKIVRLLSEKYGAQEIIGHDDISVGRKWDPGPAFDMAFFRELASEDLGDNSPNVLKTFTPGDTLNLRRGPGIQHEIIRELEDGTIVEPLQFAGNWAMVNVLNDQMNAIATGWIALRHTIPA